MIQQQHLEPYPTPEKGSGKSLTIPGQSVDVKAALLQYQRGSLENKAIGYYEAKGMNAPDFSRMDKIEKLIALGEYRDMVKESKTKLDGFAAAAQKRNEEKLKQQKIDEQTKQKDTSSK